MYNIEKLKIALYEELIRLLDANNGLDSLYLQGKIDNIKFVLSILDKF